MIDTSELLKNNNTLINSYTNNPKLILSLSPEQVHNVITMILKTHNTRKLVAVKGNEYK